MIGLLTIFAAAGIAAQAPPSVDRAAEQMAGREADRAADRRKPDGGARPYQLPQASTPGNTRQPAVGKPQAIPRIEAPAAPRNGVKLPQVSLGPDAAFRMQVVGLHFGWSF